MTISRKIEELSSSFSSKHKKVAKYILENHKKSAFMNSLELAAELGVSNPTIIRFARILGYKGFREFQSALQNEVQNELSALERRAYIRVEKAPNTFSDVFSLEIENIRMVYEQLDKTELKKTVELLQASELVYVYGKQISESVASFAAYTLGKIKDNVRLVEKWSFQDETALSHCTGRCCALVIALPRYPTSTMRFLDFLHERNIPAIVLTGAGDSFPQDKHFECFLTAPIRYYSFIDPIASVFCLVNAIAAGIIRNKGTNEIEALNAFERYVTKNHIYEQGPRTSPIDISQ